MVSNETRSHTQVSLTLNPVSFHKNKCNLMHACCVPGIKLSTETQRQDVVSFVRIG